MPRLRRSAVRGRDLTYTQAIDLITGHAFFEPFACDSDREAAWWSVRDEWLPDYIAEAPGTRPAAWWDYEAAEPRALLSGPGNSAFRKPDAPEWTRKLCFGAPSVHDIDDFKTPSTYETQLAFLQRLNLLEQSEVDYLDALAASDDPTYRQVDFCVRRWWEARGQGEWA